MDLRSAVSSQIAYGTKTLGSEENADCRLESQSMFFPEDLSMAFPGKLYHDKLMHSDGGKNPPG